MKAVAGPGSRRGLTRGTGGSPNEPGPTSRSTEASAEALPGPRGRLRHSCSLRSLAQKIDLYYGMARR